jgi:hypothetical protein
MKAIILILFSFIVFCLSCPGTSLSAAAQPSFLPDTTVVIPANSNINFKWVVPPLSPDAYKKANWLGEKYFSIDRFGQPWIGYQNEFLMNPVKGYMKSGILQSLMK